MASSLFANSFIRILDAAVQGADEGSRCLKVESVLKDAIEENPGFLPPEFLETSEGGYSRHLFHKDPAGRYSVVIMVWDRGQGTPLHDHSGMWCVEGVYQGKIQVISYACDGETGEDSGLFRFHEAEKVLAGVGETGALIPPYDYHSISNPDASPAVTIHVYGGEMEHCNMFLPEGEGCFRRQEQVLAYTP